MNLVHVGVAVKLAGAGMIGTAVGSVIAQTVSHTQVSGDWTIDLRTVCAVGFVVIGGSWHASKWMTKVNDRLDDIEEHFRHLPCQQPGALHCAAKETKH